MPFPTGVIYHLPAKEGHDGIHVETCGPNHYIVMVADLKVGTQVISISRETARALVRDWQQHLDIMDVWDDCYPNEKESE